MGAVYGNIKQATGELFEIDLDAGTTYYFWTVIGTSDGHIDDTNIQLLDADGSTVIAQNDNARTGRHGSYMEYTAPATVQDATVKVLPMQRSMRGSYQLYVSTTQPDLTAAPPPPGGTTPPPPTGGTPVIVSAMETNDNGAYDILSLSYPDDFRANANLIDGDKHTLTGAGNCAGDCGGNGNSGDSCGHGAGTGGARGARGPR